MFLARQSVNLLCALETVALLLAGGPNAKPGKDANVVANQTLFAQVCSCDLPLQTISTSMKSHLTDDLYNSSIVFAAVKFNKAGFLFGRFCFWILNVIISRSPCILSAKLFKVMLSLKIILFKFSYVVSLPFL